MAIATAKPVMAFRILPMAVNQSRLTTWAMNGNAGHEKFSKAGLIHQLQLIEGITKNIISVNGERLETCRFYGS
jgi:hypothetical protein